MPCDDRLETHLIISYCETKRDLLKEIDEEENNSKEYMTLTKKKNRGCLGLSVGNMVGNQYHNKEKGAGNLTEPLVFLMVVPRGVEPRLPA